MKIDKKCTQCKLTFPLSNFYKSHGPKSSKSGYEGRCKQCCIRKTQEWQKKNENFDVGAGKAKGKRHPRWNGGRSKSSHGHPLISIPEHRRADNNGYVRESILIVEKVFGKPIPLKSVIHHIDKDTSNNSTSNLVLCENQGYHLFVHWRQIRYEGSKKCLF